MTNPGKGGYGKRAPYTTQHYRIPTPIKPIVVMLARRYRQLLNGSIGEPEAWGLLSRIELAIVNHEDTNQVPLNYNPNDEEWHDKELAKDEDLSEDSDTDEDDDDSEPTHAEVEKRQAEINHKLLLEVKMQDREIAELKAKLQSADEAIFNTQLLLDIAQAKLTTAANILKEASLLDSRKRAVVGVKIKEALQIVNNN